MAGAGAGYFAQFHYDAWKRIPSVEIVGVMDRQSEAARATGAPPYGDLANMLRSTKPDLLDIITPSETHLDFIRIALNEGVPRIICQKPFCRNLEEARVAVRLCDEAGIDIVIHENFRFQPWYRAMKQAIKEGAIGNLQQITFRLRTGDGQGPRAYLDRQPYFQEMPRFLVHETAVHWIDTFCFLMGVPDWVMVDLRRLNPVIAGEDAAYILLGYMDGRRALFDGNRLLDHAAENHRKTFGECLAEGIDGTLELTGDGAVSLRKFGEQDKEIILEAKNWPGFGGDCVHALQSHVAAALRGMGQIENPARDYLRILEIVEAVYRSAESGKRIEVRHG